MASIATRRPSATPSPELKTEPTLTELRLLINRAEAALARAKEAAGLGDPARAEAALADASEAHDRAIALRRDLATR